ncbi:hypothetical protein [Prauserella muralis]|uniref:Uncharacterized protein n=1 Tax=Prauserella muralis TaxID=588067 RepID=A0A2V4ALL6_9PSEU|nr:hypothetical protein [Prauserella muralis]PXY20864.1 hypothetical protein BAY60_25505 [Prauserella muralis]TWE29903.1 hypothetical protein FHX69_2595 [Prauserella muralis]
MKARHVLKIHNEYTGQDYLVEAYSDLPCSDEAHPDVVTDCAADAHHEWLKATVSDYFEVIE